MQVRDLPSDSNECQITAVVIILVITVTNLSVSIILNAKVLSFFSLKQHRISVPCTLMEVSVYK